MKEVSLPPEHAAVAQAQPEHVAVAQAEHNAVAGVSAQAQGTVRGCGVVVEPEPELDVREWADLLRGMGPAQTERLEAWPGEELARSTTIYFARQRGENIPPDREDEWWVEHRAKLETSAAVTKAKWRGRYGI